jgi:carboxymethylenebutenolidase
VSENLAATFDAHVRAEFQDLDLEATMATMSGDPYVHHVPTITGGKGIDGVRDFYGRHFIGQTGRRITIPVVVVVGFEDGEVHHEHICWDQASVLVQAGVLDPAALPVTGAEQAEVLLDQGRPKNQLLGGDG